MDPSALFELFLAVAVVESAADPDAVGDQGRAVGIVQIHPIMVEDVNRITGTNITLDDRRQVKHSWYMFRTWMNYQCRRTGVTDPVELARCWNGGPEGMYKASTKRYADNVRLILNNKAVMTAARERVSKFLTAEINK